LTPSVAAEKLACLQTSEVLLEFVEAFLLSGLSCGIAILYGLIVHFLPVIVGEGNTAVIGRGQ
jgi:hypothetical protein